MLDADTKAQRVFSLLPRNRVVALELIDRIVDVETVIGTKAKIRGGDIGELIDPYYPEDC